MNEPVETDPRTLGRRSEAERTLLELAHRARVAIAVGSAAIVVIARSVGAVPDELLARGVVIVAAFSLAVVAHELPAWRGRPEFSAWTGAIADVAATALAVALLADTFPLAPALFLWPLFAAGLALTGFWLLSLAGLAAAQLAALSALRLYGDGDLAAAAGWGALLIGAAAANAQILRQFRRAQRTTQLAFDSAARLAGTATQGEVAGVLFDFLAALLEAPGAPAILYHDERGGEQLVAIASRNAELAPRSPLVLAPMATSMLRGDQGLWTSGPLVKSELPPPLAAAENLFLAPMTSRARIVGVILAGCARQRRLGEEAQRGLSRVTAHAASALERIAASQLVERQRRALTALLNAREASADTSSVAAWTVRTARDIVGAGGSFFVLRGDGGRYAVADRRSDAASAAEAAAGLLDVMFERRLPVLVADASAEARFPLGPPLARGSLAALPVRGHDAALLVHHPAPEGLTTLHLELLIMLADQAGLLLTKAGASS